MNKKFRAQFATITYILDLADKCKGKVSEEFLGEVFENYVKLQMGIIQPKDGQEINPKEYESLEYNRMADWYIAA